MEVFLLDQLKAHPKWVILLFTLGFFTVLRILLGVLKWVYVSFLRPSKNLKKYGSWAVVTGPTGGIVILISFHGVLNVEYKNMGIDVQCQVPLYVATKMASIKRSSFFVPSTDSYAKSGIRHIGYESRCTPYWPRSWMWGIGFCLPKSIIDAWRLRFCLRIRNRGQLKDSRKKD